MKLPRLTRRRFLGLAAGSAVATGLYTWQVEPHWLSVVERDLPIAGAPPSWIDRRIAQLSDLHVGHLVDPDHLISSLKVTAELKPDLTVITGDFMTPYRAEQVDAVGRLMEHLPETPLGTVAILGNHDYGHGWGRGDVADALAERLRSLGITVLRNEQKAIDGLTIVGIDDVWGTNFKPERIVPKVDWTKPTLTLCHNPDGVDRPAMAAVRGWVLSGHTHGGQCKPPFLPPPLLPVNNRRYTRGEFDIGEGRRLYINTGLGYVRKVRFNVRPEVTLFRVVAG